MKRRFLVAGLLVLVYGMVSAAAPTQAQTPVVVSPVIHGGLVEHSGVHAGDSFIVEIQADSVAALASAQMEVTYDPAALSFNSVEVGDDFDNVDCLNESADDGAGTLNLAFACSDDVTGDEVVLWRIVFDSASVGESAATDITVEDAGLLLNDSAVGAPEEIDSAGATATATLVVGECGDENDDGVVNVIDVTINLQIVAELLTNPSDVQLVLGDLNRDGSVGIADAIIALQDIVGVTDITECGPPGALGGV